MAAPASMTPLLGLTQYLRGAVVFTLKHTLRSVGLPSFRLVVTTSVKGPVGGRRLIGDLVRKVEKADLWSGGREGDRICFREDSRPTTLSLSGMKARRAEVSALTATVKPPCSHRAAGDLGSVLTPASHGNLTIL